jgi:hypothetical protein
MAPQPVHQRWRPRNNHILESIKNHKANEMHHPMMLKPGIHAANWKKPTFSLAHTVHCHRGKIVSSNGTRVGPAFLETGCHNHFDDCEDFSASAIQKIPISLGSHL